MTSPSLLPATKRMRLAVWCFTGLIVVADAVVSTPLGLSFMLVVPLSIAASLFPRREIVVLTLVCIAARLLFGPVGDPLGLHGVTFEVSEQVQLWVSAAFSIATYLGVAFTFQRIAAQQVRIGDLKGQAERDPLTGCANRRALESFLGEHGDTEGSVIAIDADHFKRVNDTHGHDAGDRVLQELARILESASRRNDLVARVGGEEFVLVLPTAPLTVATRIAEKILESMRQSSFDIGKGEPLKVTASAGCATGPLGTELLKFADEALYQAKQSGRDRVSTAAALAAPSPASVDE